MPQPVHTPINSPAPASSSNAVATTAALRVPGPPAAGAATAPVQASSSSSPMHAAARGAQHATNTTNIPNTTNTLSSPTAPQETDTQTANGEANEDSGAQVNTEELKDVRDSSSGAPAELPHASGDISA
jgi:hypothetical protein